VSEPRYAKRRKRESLRRFYSRWLPLALGLAAVANLTLTFFLPRSALPIRFHEDGSLTELVHTEQRAVDHRFGFYLELDDATDGGTLIVPVGSVVDPELAEGFAGFDVVERRYDPTEVTSDITSAPQLGVLETDRGDIPYSIVAGEDDLWWVALAGGTLYIIPEQVAPVPVSP
jgi:hypothetical protein